VDVTGEARHRLHENSLGNPEANTHDWMIGFAPANDPKIAVAVVVPYQDFGGTGAGIAGPIMKAMLDAAILPNG
jgi:penicillin-binding protein A